MLIVYMGVRAFGVIYRGSSMENKIIRNVIRMGEDGGEIDQDPISSIIDLVESM